MSYVSLWLWLEFGTLLLGFLFQFLLLKVGLTSGPHPVWRQTARQHLLHFITTHIYIYGSRWAMNFVLSAFKRSPTRMDFRMCVGPELICPMRLPGTTAGWTTQYLSTYTHIHSSYHDYNRSVLHTTCMNF